MLLQPPGLLQPPAQHVLLRHALPCSMPCMWAPRMTGPSVGRPHKVSAHALTTPALTCSARLSRCMLQGLPSYHMEEMPTWGLPISSSFRPGGRGERSGNMRDSQCVSEGGK